MSKIKMKNKNKLSWLELQKRVKEIKNAQARNMGVNVSVIGFKIRKSKIIPI